MQPENFSTLVNVLWPAASARQQVFARSAFGFRRIKQTEKSYEIKTMPFHCQIARSETDLKQQNKAYGR